MTDDPADPAEYRVAFDFEVLFSNGGGLKGWDFRLDIAGTTISDEDLADYIVRDLRLLMVGSVAILNKRFFAEKHKRTGAANPAQGGAGSAAKPRLFDLSRWQPGPILGATGNGTTIAVPLDRALLPLERSANLDGILVRLKGMSGRAITRLALAPALENAAGKAVLIETGWSAKWGSGDYFRGHPFLAEDAAHHLRSLQVALVGIDSFNIDDTGDPARPARTILLGAGIPIIENLIGLDALPLHGFRFSATPLPVAGMSMFPVRAWAVAS